MTGNFRVEIPFETKPPRLKDLINQHVMGEVWIRDSPFGPVTDTIILAEKFGVKHSNILRAVSKCRKEIGSENKYRLDENLMDSFYMAGAKGKQRRERKVDVTEFGLALLLLYINSPKARQISAEILYRFFVLKTYIKGLSDQQLGAIKGYFRKQLKEQK